MRIALMFLMLTLTSLAQGQTQIYKVVDANGNITFTDKPPISSQDNSSSVELNKINISAPTQERRRNTNLDDNKPEPSVDYAITITSPPDSTTIPMGPGNFSLSASVSPALENGDKLQLILNGEPYGRPQSTSNWGLTNVLRGAHDLSIQAMNNSGEVISQSRPVRVYVLRPSKLYRN